MQVRLLAFTGCNGSFIASALTSKGRATSTLGCGSGARTCEWIGSNNSNAAVAPGLGWRVRTQNTLGGKRGGYRSAYTTAAAGGGNLKMTVTANVIEAVHEDLVSMIRRTKAMPILVRLAWHDCGDYDARLGTGGANGSIRFEKEMQHGGNAGLPGALNLLKPIKEKHPGIGWADLI
eukprot:ctg_3680.g613